MGQAIHDREENMLDLPPTDGERYALTTCVLTTSFDLSVQQKSLPSLKSYTENLKKIRKFLHYAPLLSKVAQIELKV